jgi:tetratricopeptide (TPR) repeat protein
MGNPEWDWHLPEVRGLTRENGIRLLDRAAEVGLLTARGDGAYSIHPAVPCFFRMLFEERDAEGRERSLSAFVEAIGELGGYYHAQYESGNRKVVGVLRAEEPNLLHARALARRKQWWPRVISTMQGLQALYEHAGRVVEWARLVDEIVPDFIDPSTGASLPGRQDYWNFVTQYRVRLKGSTRQWAEAESIQMLLVAWNRQRCLDGNPNRVRTLSVSLHDLGEIQRGMGKSDCVEAYLESFELAQRIGDQAGSAVAAFNLGNAYIGLHELAEAEEWYRKSLDLRSDADHLGRARCLGQLGQVCWERFRQARKQGQGEPALACYLKDALRFYHDTLKTTPPDAGAVLATTHNQLGVVYLGASRLDLALHHFRESIRIEESIGNLYGAAQSRRNIALVLGGEGRFDGAKDYAIAALRNFQTFGAGAQQDVLKTLELIAAIDKAISSPS